MGRIPHPSTSRFFIGRIEPVEEDLSCVLEDILGEEAQLTRGAAVAELDDASIPWIGYRHAFEGYLLTLIEAGHHIEPIPHPTHGLHYLQEHTPHLILVQDWFEQYFGMDLPEEINKKDLTQITIYYLRQLRQQPSVKPYPILVLYVDKDPDIVRQFELAGATACLNLNAYSPAEFCREVEKCIF